MARPCNRAEATRSFSGSWSSSEDLSFDSSCSLETIAHARSTTPQNKQKGPGESFFFIFGVNLAHAGDINLVETIFTVLQVVVIYVENLLKLENSSIGQVGGGMIFMMVMERLRDLDVSIVYMFYTNNVTW